MEFICYHGIGENLLKYESIMKYGIVSTQMAQDVDAYNKNGGVNHNGDDRISVAVPHDISQWGALNLYILENGISFKIQDCEYTLANTTENSSEYFDEAFVDKQISIKNISGIVVNNNMRAKKIRELSVIGVPANNEVINITKNIIGQLEAQGLKEEKFNGVYELIDEYNNISNNPSFDFLEQDKQLLIIRKKMDSILSTAVEELYKQKCGKENVSVLDVIELCNDRNLPIYDENDIITECNGKIIEDSEKDIFEHEATQFQKQERSLTIIPPKNRITSWFKEKWTSIREKFSKVKTTKKKQHERIKSSNSNKSITNKLKYLVIDNKNNHIEKKALESIKRKEQFEIAEALVEKNNIEVSDEQEEI